MSCMMMDSKPLSKIADFIAYLMTYKYDFTGISVPESLSTVLFEDCYDSTFMEWKPDRIYKKLYRLNQSAYNGRYENHQIDYAMPPYEGTDIFKRCEWDGHFVVEGWHYEMASRIACFNYQCEEDATRQGELHLAMIDLQHELFSFIVVNNPLFHTNRWGT